MNTQQYTRMFNTNLLHDIYCVPLLHVSAINFTLFQGTAVLSGVTAYLESYYMEVANYTH